MTHRAKRALPCVFYAAWPLGSMLVLIAPLIVASCTEPQRVTSPRVPSKIDALIVSPSDSNWNTYTADIAVEVTGGYSTFNPTTTPTRAFGFHVVRTLGSNNVWNSEITLKSTAPTNQSMDPGDVNPNLASIETDDRNSYYRVYDSTGALVTQTLPDTTHPTGDGVEQPVAPQPGTFPRHPTSPPSSDVIRGGGAPSLSRITSMAGDAAGADTVDVHAWADRIIVGKKARARLQAYFKRHFGPAKGLICGLNRYTLQRDGMLLEALLDPQTGAIAEENLVENGQLVPHKTYDYQQLDATTYVLSHSHVERAAPDSSGPGVTLDMQYRNVQVAIGWSH